MAFLGIKYRGIIGSGAALGIMGIKTPSQTFQPESVAYFTAVEDAGGTLTDNVKAEFDAFVLREKDAGRWSKLKRLYPFLGGKINSAVIDAITTNSATNSNFVDADADSLIGLQGDGSTKILTEQTQITDIIAASTDIQGGVFILEKPSTNARYFMGVTGIGLWRIRYFDSTSGGGMYSTLQSDFVSAGTELNSTGVNSFIGARYSATSAFSLVNGIEKSEYTTPSNTPFQALRFVTYFGSGDFNDAKYFGTFLAEGMTLQETKDFESSYKTFINNIKAYEALMDSYSGAAAAYSLRKLYSSYEGSAINVRRSSDNATQDIGFDGYVLDTASLLSFVGAGDGYVTTWYDQSGNGLDVTQSTASNQAKIVSSGVVNTSNGKASLLFNAFTTPYTSSSNFNHNAQLTAFATWQTSGGNQGLFQIGSVNTLGSMFRLLSTYYVARATSGSDALYGSTSTSPLIQTGYFSNGRQEVFVNNVIGSSIGATSLGNATNSVLSIGSLTGSIYALTGNIQEIIFYSSDRRSDRSNINTLINTYYNIY